MFEFRPAVRDKTSVLLALAGASGAGKTLTAILMAFGLAYPEMTPAQILTTIAKEGKSRIVFIDTEGGRGKHYAPGPGITPNFKDSFPFEYGEIRAPYTPEVYQDAMVSADAAGFAVIIIDSMSHEIESEGGIHEIADQYEQGVLKPGKTQADADDRQNGWKAWEIKPVKSPGNWKEPKTRHKRMVNRAVQLRAHVIFCLRAEEKMLLKQEPKLDRNGEPEMWNGKPKMQTVVVPAAERPLLERWVPICEKRFMYEMTVSFLLLPSAPGVGHPIKNLQDQFRPMFPEGQHLGVANGTALAAWSQGREPDGKRGTYSNEEQLSDRPGGLVDEPLLRRHDVNTATGWAAQYVDDMTGAATVAEIDRVKAKGAKGLGKLADADQSLYDKCDAAEMDARERVKNEGLI